MILSRRKGEAYSPQQTFLFYAKKSYNIYQKRVEGMVKKERIKILKEGHESSGPVVYWMSRDQRIHDNWALLYAQEIAERTGAPFAIIFCLMSNFLKATIRQYDCMLKGLREIEQELSAHNIPFFLLSGSPDNEIIEFVDRYKIKSLVTDFDPLKLKRKWKNDIAKQLTIPFYEIDAHNIIPCWHASPKLEYGAYTIRPKIRRLMSEFLEEYPKLGKHPFVWNGKREPVDWDKIKKNLNVDRGVRALNGVEPGEKAAREILDQFITVRLDDYDRVRNDPNKAGQSDLSPYLHFGHISAQRIALEVAKLKTFGESKDAFLEELIVRRELSDNFCFYNDYYDSFEGFPEWAKKTLDQHRKDTRPYIYTIEDFEGARTHDDLWNAAQMEMVKRGKMHGYMRMYWAKKILEWTRSPEEAMKVAILLNDRYELDGRDPNGYTGIAWSIGGVHDRAWNERNVFGKIRYMSYNGCRSKFNINSYIKSVDIL
jgi:deoxyribodipyrimidine photo-lyase